MSLPDASEARSLASAKNDHMVELREKIAKAIAKAIEEHRFEARIRITDEPLDAIREITAELTTKGYTVTSTETPEEIKLLVIQYGRDRTESDTVESPITAVPQIDYKGIELPDAVAPITKEV